MDFASILKAYLEIGILGLSGCLLIYLVYQNHKKDLEQSTKKDDRIDKKDSKNEDRLDALLELIEKQNREYQEQQSKNTKALIDGVINGIVNHVPSQEENIKITKVSEEIDLILNELLVKTGADRANLVQYHNGGKGINKQSFLKMSMTNEQVKFGVSAFMLESKDQFRSTLAYFTKELSDNEYCYIQDVEDLKDVDNSMYDYLKSKGIGAKFGIAIKNEDGVVIAYVSLEYINKEIADINVIDKVLRDKQKVVETLLSL